MSIQDRDWYKDSYKEKETAYNGDFSLHSKKEKTNNVSSEKENNRCGAEFGIKIHKGCLIDYNYTCPKCGQKVYVKFGKPTSVLD